MFNLKKKKEKTCNEYMNIRDIQKNFLYTKDNKIMCYIKIEPINLELLSVKEKLNSARQITGQLSSETKEMKFFSISRVIDISTLLDDLKGYLEESINQKQKELIKKHMEETKKLTAIGEAVQKQNYMIIWQDMNDYAENDILKRAIDIVNKLATCKVKARVLDRVEIIELCSDFTNKKYAFYEDTDYEEYFPLIKREGEYSEEKR